jgi:hypothetical protein
MKLYLCCDGHEPVAFVAHPRNFFGPVHVGHRIDSARFLAELNDPGCAIVFNGMPLASGKTSRPVKLLPGRNLFTVSVTAVDGRTVSVFNARVYRDFSYPLWELVKKKSPWAPRDSAGELVFKNRMWLLGGYIPQTSNDVWSSADGIKWRRCADVPSRKGIDIPIACVFRGKMMLADLDGVLFSSADGRKWSVVTDNPPWRGRQQAGCVVFDGRIWVMGGKKDGALLNDVWSSSDGITWKLEMPNAPWSKRQIHHTPLVLDGRMWLLGGGVIGSDYYPFRAWNDVWCSGDGKHWEQVLEHAPWVPRIWGSAAVYRNRMWIIGGFRSEPTWENLGDAWYSADGKDWRQLETAPYIRHSGAHNVPFIKEGSVWERRHEHSVFVHQGALWVAGGMVWPLMNDVWKISIPGLSFLTQPVIEAYAGTKYEYCARADFNPSRKSVRYRLKRGPVWLCVDGKTGILRGTAPSGGNYDVCLEACDASGEVARQLYTLHVLDMK